MIQLANSNKCTGCGACSYKCPKQCITMQPDERGIVLPVINTEKCIECNSCVKACPALNPVEQYSPLEAYAAWSNDEEERRTSASGGVAAELYKYALANDYKIVGAVHGADLSVKHILADDATFISHIKNSKYVFSSLTQVLPEIKASLKNDEKIMFIGLPCQVAALKKVFNGSDNLLLIEVVCHGITPQQYLDEHVKGIEKKLGKRTARMCFRDPEYYTYTFTFTLYDEEGSCFYAQRTEDGDNYQFGYHKGVTYRENCYSCRYAQRSRVADITISDYKGLGKLAPCDYTSRKVSCILVNSHKGKTFLDQVFECGTLHADLRPIDEPINGDRQLREPTRKIPERFVFERVKYKYGFSFAASMLIAKTNYKLRMLRGNILRYPKQIIKSIVKRK